MEISYKTAPVIMRKFVDGEGFVSTESEKVISTIIEVTKETYLHNRFFHRMMREIRHYEMEYERQFDIRVAMTHELIMHFNALRPVELPITRISRYGSIYDYDIDLIKDEPGMKATIEVLVDSTKK